MTTKPARCCVLTQRGTRCANEPSPVRSTRMIGPVEIAACGLDGHQRAMRSLPDFVRHDAYCGAVGCDRPSNAGICPKHRDQYRDFGITEHMLLATEPAPMPTPATQVEMPAVQPPPTPEAQTFDVLDAAAKAWAALSQEERDKCLVAASMVAISSGYEAFAPPIEPQEAAGVGAPTPPEAVKAEPTIVGGVPLFIGAVTTATEPTAPGPTVAELETQLAAERARADAAERDAVEERERADEALTQAREANDQLKAIFLAVAGYLPESGDPLPQRVATALEREHERGDEAVQYLQELRDVRNDSRAELHAVCLLMQRLGSYGPDASAMLMRLLPVESRRALLEIEVADARAELARARANVVYPPTPERLAEVSARIASLDARIAALDHSPDAGKKVN